MPFALLFGIQRVFNFFGLHVSRRQKGVNSTSAENEQLRLLGTDVRCIFEVGAADGRDALTYSKAFPEAKIYAFEPLPENFKKLAEVAKENPNIVAIKKAVSDVPGKAQFNVTALSDASSLLESNQTGSTFDRYTVPVNTIEVDVTTLDIFTAQEKITEIDLLKMDAQGAELLILHGAKHLLENTAVRMIYTEINFMDIYRAGTKWYDLASYLGNFGFKLHAFYNLNYNQNGQLAWADAIFTKEG
jgi:FkbM family methyltransferase